MVGAGVDTGLEGALIAEVSAHQGKDQVFVLNEFADHGGALFGVGHIEDAGQSVKKTLSVQDRSAAHLLESFEQKCGTSGGFCIGGVEMGFEVSEAGTGMKRAPALEQVGDHACALLEDLLEMVVHDQAQGGELFVAVVACEQALHRLVLESRRALLDQGLGVVFVEKQEFVFRGEYQGFAGMGPNGDVETVCGGDLGVGVFLGESRVFLERVGDPDVKRAEIRSSPMEAETERGKAKLGEKVFACFSSDLLAGSCKFVCKILEHIFFTGEERKERIFFEVLEPLEKVFGEWGGVEADAKLAALGDVAVHLGGWGSGLVDLLRNQKRK